MTGRNLIPLLCNESELSLTNIKENAQRGLKAKSKELHHSIQGFFEDHHRFQLVGMMEMITTFEKHIAEITDRMDTLTAGHQDLLNRLDEIPGIDKKSAQSMFLKKVKGCVYFSRTTAPQWQAEQQTLKDIVKHLKEEGVFEEIERQWIQ